MIWACCYFRCGVQVVNGTTESVWVTTDESTAADDAPGVEQAPAGEIVLIPNRQVKQSAVSTTAPGSTVRGTFSAGSEAVKANCNVWTSAGAAAAYPTQISVIATVS